MSLQFPNWSPAVWLGIMFMVLTLTFIGAGVFLCGRGTNRAGGEGYIVAGILLFVFSIATFISFLYQVH